MSEQPSLTQLIESYLDFILSPERIGQDEYDRALSLLKILDELAIRTYDKSGNFTPDVSGNESPLDYQDTYKILMRHFPDYAYYATVLDINDAGKDNNLAAGDPFDDMTDIAVDLSEVLSMTKKFGEAVGQYEFANSYRIHWGFHLRQLQVYLHCQLTGF